MPSTDVDLSELENFDSFRLYSLPSPYVATNATIFHSQDTGRPQYVIMRYLRMDQPEPDVVHTLQAAQASAVRDSAAMDEGSAATDSHESSGERALSAEYQVEMGGTDIRIISSSLSEAQLASVAAELREIRPSGD